MAGPLQEIMNGWVDGWSFSRGVPGPHPVPGGWFLGSSSPQENGRIVLTRPTPEWLATIVEAEHPGDLLVKFPGEPEVWLPQLPAGWVPEPAGWLMTRTLGPMTPGTLPNGYSLEIESTVTLVRVMAELGNRALDAGRRRAELGATVEGRALNERLGWQVVSPMTGAYHRPSG